MLAAALAMKGRGVIAIDADPDANLASALGVPPAEQPTPVAEMRELIVQRTGATDGYGGYFKLNPKVDDIPETYARQIGSIRLLVLGGISRGGGGCLCPASALVKALVTHLVLGKGDAIVMDMEAGIEHLGRATAQSMDALIIVVNESPWSVQTALRVRDLAADIGLKGLFAVANAVREPANLERIRGELGEIPLIGHLPYDEQLRTAVVGVAADGGLEPSKALTAHLATVEGILSALPPAG
jgi:CO dehydrogenase maturation factor